MMNTICPNAQAIATSTLRSRGPIVAALRMGAKARRAKGTLCQASWASKARGRNWLQMHNDNSDAMVVHAHCAKCGSRRLRNGARRAREETEKEVETRRRRRGDEHKLHICTTPLLSASSGERRAPPMWATFCSPGRMTSMWKVWRTSFAMLPRSVSTLSHAPPRGPGLQMWVVRWGRRVQRARTRM